MRVTKSPNPDGMSTFFFQKYWSLVSGYVVHAVLNFLNNGDFIDGINETFIVLIPKIPNAQNMKQFRLISLCNVFYKIISKVLANRLKVILPSLISKSQSAFVRNRHITDNVLIAYELIHDLKGRRLGKGGYMALKLNISKAYDKIYRKAFLGSYDEKDEF